MSADEDAAGPVEPLAALCSLDDGTRRALYDHVVAAGQPVNRDQVSAATGVDRSLVAYHLDKLVREGLLATSFARPEGRRGPGAGRPAKYYRRDEREIAVSLPPRDYRLVAEVLARAASSDDSGAMHRRVERTAREMGSEMGATGAGGDLLGQLRCLGFEPYDDDGVTRLRNCPFHPLARDHTDLVCTLNLALLSGLTDALDARVRPRLDPGTGRCCVALDRA